MKSRICIDCGRADTGFYVKKRCRKCYRAFGRRSKGIPLLVVYKGKILVCVDCGKIVTKKMVKSRCPRCYHALRRREKGVQPRVLAKDKPPCSRCGQPKIHCRGLCESCYRKLKRQKREIPYRRPDSGWQGGIVHKKYNNHCAHCGMSRKEHFKRFNQDLHIHHIDGNGCRSKNPNHNPNNLLLVCASCHAAIHGPEKGRKSGQARREKKKGAENAESQISV